MNSSEADHPRQRALMEACILVGVAFYWSPGWQVLIDRSGVVADLSALVDDFTVLGFDSFTLNGHDVYPRLDYYTDFGTGISVEEALYAIREWPSDMGLFLEVVLAEPGGAG